MLSRRSLCGGLGPAPGRKPARLPAILGEAEAAPLLLRPLWGCAQGGGGGVGGRLSVAVRRELIAFARRGLGERLGAAVTQSRSRPFAARPEGRRWAARGPCGCAVGSVGALGLEV